MEHIIYLFEGFRLDAGRRQLSSSGGVVVPLNSRAMEALVMLVSGAGELVTKKQLLEGVWPSAVVEDNNINQCILAIRKALGEVAGTNRFIMTVPGRGYRFVAPVIVQKRVSLDVAPVDLPSTEGRRRRAWIAVPGLLATLAAALLLLGRSQEHAEPLLPGGSGEMLLQLRGGSDPATAATEHALLACLRQRPDLHLQVEVRVVRGGKRDRPVWTGRYIAGVQDLRDANPRADAGDACEQLAAR